MKTGHFPARQGSRRAAPDGARAPGYTLAIVAIVLVVACGQGVSSAPAADDQALTLRLGYFPNLTHAPALSGLKKGFFANALGSTVKIETHTFNAGGDAVTAILSNSIDATFVGPSPTTNAFVQSHGQAIRVVAGATSGGALLVVKPSITSVQDLKGKKIADPQLGATQDVALRWFLKSNGFATDSAGGGVVSVLPQDNSLTLTAFRQGQIDGAWVPEPWASRLVIEGGGKVLVDERDLWPQGKFVTTNLIVRTDFLQAHPKRIAALLEGLYQSVAYLSANAEGAQSLTNDAVGEITGKKLAAGVVSAAWPHLAFTLDPLPATLKASADHAHAVGLLASVDLKGIYDLRLLNQVLASHNQPAVQGL
jgi:NitT/TauT family transport system substrate-binding protein